MSLTVINAVIVPIVIYIIDFIKTANITGI